MDLTQEIENLVKEESTFKFYWMTPNLIDDLPISHRAFRLYAHLKRVAGENGACWQSTFTLSIHCKMSKANVSRAKKELAGFNLISIETKKNRQGGRDYHEITIKDIWSWNAEHSRMAAEQVSNGNLARFPDETCKFQTGTLQVSSENLKNTTTKKNPRRTTKEEKPVLEELPPTSGGAPEQPVTDIHKVKEPSLWSLCMATLADVCGMDLSVARNAARLGKELKEVWKSKKAQPTPELIRHMYGDNNVPLAWWYRNHWKGQRGERPLPSDVTSTWGIWPENGAKIGVDEKRKIGNAKLVQKWLERGDITQEELDNYLDGARRVGK